MPMSRAGRPKSAPARRTRHRPGRCGRNPWRDSDMATADFDTAAGNGGETHQHVPKGGPHGDGQGHLTTNQGIRVSDNQNSLKSGERGPTLLEDFVLREKIFHFDHERIPERMVHARGSGAHGYFELYTSLAGVTKADLFQRPGEKTPVFV